MGSCLNEYRCRACKKLLFKGLLVEGSVEAKCRGCHAVTVVSATRFNRLLCMIDPCPRRVPHEPNA